MALAWEVLTDVARQPDLIKQHAGDRLWRMLGPLASARVHDHPFVIAQLGQSLDGRIATVSGHSHYINGPDALKHLHRLRALVDGVIVGANTVVLDNPSLTVRHVTGTNPARIIIDPNRRVNVSSQCFVDDGHRVIIVGPAKETDPHHVQHLAANVEGQYPPAWIVKQLSKLGITRLLVEGGATTVSRFMNARLLDHLHILTGALIIGSGPHGLALAEIDTLKDALRPDISVFPFDSGDVLFDCAFNQPKGGAA